MKYLFVLMTITCLSINTVLFATDGTWNVDNSGIWANSDNWVSGNVPNGIASTANFTYNITEYRYIHLNTNRVIGNLNFDDDDTFYYLAGPTNLNKSSYIFLDNGDSKPVISVNGSAYLQYIGHLNLSIAGTNGFIVNGNSRLYIGGDNNISGDVICSNPLFCAYENSNVLKNTSVILDGCSFLCRPNNLNVKKITVNKCGPNGGVGPLWNETTSINAPIHINTVGTGSITVFQDSDLTLNDNIILNSNATILITGPDAYLEIKAPVLGMNSLKIAESGENSETTVSAPCSYLGNTELISLGSNPRFELGVNQAFPCGDINTDFLLATDSSIANSSAIFDLNNYTQQISNLSINFGGSGSGLGVEIAGNSIGLLKITNIFWTLPKTNDYYFKLTGGKIVNYGAFFLNMPMIITNATFLQNFNGWNGSADSKFELEAGAKIGGIGWLADPNGNDASSSLVIPDSATITPGNSIGTVHCWNLEFQEGSFYDWDIGIGAYDIINCHSNLFLPTTENSITVNVINVGDVSADQTNFLIQVNAALFGNVNSLFMNYPPDLTGPLHPQIYNKSVIVTDIIVPEPTSLILLLLFVAATIFRK